RSRLIASTRDAASDAVAFAPSPLAILSRAVMCGNSAKFWNAMPIPRRSGAAPTMERPSTRISPWSGSNMPAIMRRSTVFPLPDGPKTATISPGSTVSETPSAGRTTPKLLPTDLSSSRAIQSAFHRAERQSFDQIALRIEREQQGRHHRQHNRRGDLAILNARSGDESKRAHRHRLLVGGGKDQGKDKIVPAEDERQEPGGRNPRAGKGDGDTRECLAPGMAGKAIGVLDVGAHILKIAAPDPQDQRQRDQLIDPDDAEIGVVETELLIVERQRQQHEQRRREAERQQRECDRLAQPEL